jgi:Dyp-type peroxidase family
MAIDLTRPGLDPDDRDVRLLLSDLQGNILKGHDRESSDYVVVTFRPGRVDEIRRWIHDFAETRITTAWRQHEAAIPYRTKGVDGGLFGGLYLSAQGYDAIGFPRDHIPRDRGRSFVRGMKQAPLDDPSSEKWDPAYRGEVHALVLLASDNREEVGAAVAEVERQLKPLTEALKVEHGVRWHGEQRCDDRDKRKQSIEPFGFADDISHPQFFKKDVERVRAEGADQWDPSAPPDLVLVRDPNGVGAHSYGSYFVFRKLEQDVKGFRDHLACLAKELGVDPKLAGAYVMGRFRNGTPVVLQSRPLPENPCVNNFNYAGDRDGARCPLHAHIRKVNPRGDTGRLAGVRPDLESDRRIARRGIPYGEQPPPGELPRGRVGLLFAAFQGDIRTQFEFLQGAWANSFHFVRQGVGLDPVIGRAPPHSRPPSQEWPARYGDETARPIQAGFHSYVTLKGGEYFFAPSLSFLTHLCRARPVGRR